jgi:hypothetical protein
MKKENFDLSDIKKFAPKRFDSFAFAPSLGASWGILVVWASKVFTGTPKEVNPFSVTVELTSRYTSQVWSLTCVYGPERSDFVTWLKNIQIDAHQNWLFLGDFNFYRSIYDRNKVGADMNDIFISNNIISTLGLLEICNKILCWKGLIGFSPLHTGL